MSQIKIPEGVLPGFIELSKLSNIQAKKFSSFLKTIPVGVKMNEINEFLNSILKVKNSKEIVQTLISFSELLEPENVNFKELASNLASSAKEIVKPDISESEIISLEHNLELIFKNSENLKLTLKARNLAYEEDSIFTESKIISDIRLIFNDNITHKKRYAIVIHKLHINFKRNNEPKDIFLALDMGDLKSLKKDIDRAIKKEEVIKNDYKENIHFINYGL